MLRSGCQSARPLLLLLLLLIVLVLVIVIDPTLERGQEKNDYEHEEETVADHSKAVC